MFERLKPVSLVKRTPKAKFPGVPDAKVPSARSDEADDPIGAHDGSTLECSGGWGEDSGGHEMSPFRRPDRRPRDR